MKNRKGQLTIYFVFIVTAIILVTITAVVIPLGVRINTEFYKAGAQLIADSNTSISSDSDVKTSIQNTFSSAISAEQDNIEVGTGIFQYSWIIVLILLALILFLYSRRMIEVGGIA
jgi:hypothetical protein